MASNGGNALNLDVHIVPHFSSNESLNYSIVEQLGTYLKCTEDRQLLSKKLKILVFRSTGRPADEIARNVLPCLSDDGFKSYLIIIDTLKPSTMTTLPHQLTEKMQSFLTRLVINDGELVAKSHPFHDFNKTSFKNLAADIAKNHTGYTFEDNSMEHTSSGMVSTATNYISWIWGVSTQHESGAVKERKEVKHLSTLENEDFADQEKLMQLIISKLLALYVTEQGRMCEDISSILDASTETNKLLKIRAELENSNFREVQRAMKHILQRFENPAYVEQKNILKKIETKLEYPKHEGLLKEIGFKLVNIYFKVPNKLLKEILGSLEHHEFVKQEGILKLAGIILKKTGFTEEEISLKHILDIFEKVDPLDPDVMLTKALDTLRTYEKHVESL